MILKVKANLMTATLCGVFIAFMASVTAVLYQPGAEHQASIWLKLLLAVIFYLVPVALFVVGVDNLRVEKDRSFEDKTPA
ncbi:MAG: hypothetical protein AAF353_02585, partial [Pseudomonadota bacterium]